MFDELIFKLQSIFQQVKLAKNIHLRDIEKACMPSKFKNLARVVVVGKGRWGKGRRENGVKKGTTKKQMNKMLYCYIALRYNRKSTLSFFSLRQSRFVNFLIKKKKIPLWSNSYWKILLWIGSRFKFSSYPYCNSCVITYFGKS